MHIRTKQILCLKITFFKIKKIQVVLANTHEILRHGIPEFKDSWSDYFLPDDQKFTGAGVLKSEADLRNLAIRQNRKKF